MRGSRVPYFSTAGFIFACTLIGVVGGLLLHQLQQMRAANSEAIRSLMMQAQIKTLLVLLDDAETGQRGFLITGDPTYLQPYQFAVRQLPERTAKLSKLTSGDALEEESIAQLNKLIAAKLAELNETIHARQAGGFPAAARIVNSDAGRETMSRMRAILNSMQDEQIRQYEGRESLSAQSFRASIGFALAALALAIALVLGSALLFTHQYHNLERTELALQESESRFRLLVDSVVDYAIFALDPSGRVTSWNAGAKRIKGYQAEEIVGQHFSRFYPPEDAAAGEPEKALKIAAEEGRFKTAGWRVRKDGSSFWASVAITALRDGRGQLAGYAKVTRDLTERKLAEDKLRASEEQFRAVAETASEAVISADDAGKIVYWNRAAQQMFGYTAAEISGQPVTSIMPEKFRAACQHGIDRYTATREARIMGKTVELAGRRRDGSEFPIELSLASWETRSGLFYTGIVRDVTERHEKERALRESERAFRHLSSQLFHIQESERRRLGLELHDSAGQFLVMLKMRLESMRPSLEGDNSARQKLQDCLRLTDEVIQEVRATSYELYPPMLEEAGLRLAVPWFVDGFMARTGIDITLEFPSEFERPSPDVELAIFRVLQESLTNIRRHSGSASARVRVENANGILRLEVSDHGKGIPAEVMDAFVHDSASKLGIGLRGMKERIRHLGGKLEVTSNGNGSVVSAAVPIRDTERTMAAT